MDSFLEDKNKFDKIFGKTQNKLKSNTKLKNPKKFTCFNKQIKDTNDYSLKKRDEAMQNKLLSAFQQNPE